jgi:hypothetical protein
MIVRDMGKINDFEDSIKGLDQLTMTMITAADLRKDLNNLAAIFGRLDTFPLHLRNLVRKHDNAIYDFIMFLGEVENELTAIKREIRDEISEKLEYEE